MAVILCADALSTYILTVMAVIKKAGGILLVIAAAYDLLFLLATIKYDRTWRPPSLSIELSLLRLESQVRAG